MGYRLTKEELSAVKNMPINDIAPEWLISMVDELEGWRKISEKAKQLCKDVVDKHV